MKHKSSVINKSISSPQRQIIIFDNFGTPSIYYFLQATFNTTNQDNHPENRQQQSNHKIPRTVNKQTKTVTFKDC